MAKVLADHLLQPCRVLRLEGSAPSAEQAKYMDLDCTSEESLDVLRTLARQDADEYFGRSTNDASQAGFKPPDPKTYGRRSGDFSILKDAFMNMPVA
jgi:hypothetical protein